MDGVVIGRIVGRIDGSVLGPNVGSCDGSDFKVTNPHTLVETLR